MSKNDSLQRSRRAKNKVLDRTEALLQSRTKKKRMKVGGKYYWVTICPTAHAIGDQATTTSMRNKHRSRKQNG